MEKKRISFIRAKHYARRALLIQYFLMGFIFSSLLSRMPAISEVYDMNTAQLSLVLFSMSVGSLCIMPFCGYLVGRFGCKKLSVTGFIYMAMFAGIALMPNKYILYLYCGLYGMMVSLTDLSVNGNSIIVENAYKRPIISMFHALFYVGMCSGALLSVVLITNGISVAAHHITIAIICFFSYFFIRSCFLKETPSKSFKSSGFKILFPHGILLLIAFIALLGRIVEGSISDWSTVYMKKVVEFPDNLAPLGLAIYAAFMSVGRFMGDFIRSRFKDSFILMCCCSLAAFGLLIIILGTEFYFAVIGLFIAGLGMSCLVPIIYSLAGRQKDVTPAMGLAMVNTISGTGFLFGPFIIGMIADKTSMRVSFCYVFLLASIMVILTYFYRKKENNNI